jgi:serine/threonine protein phosphatase PrpC
VVAVPKALTLPYEHLFLGERASQWGVRCPGGGQVSVHTAVSPDKETSNEDGAMVIWPSPGRMVLAVADGVGGMPDGESASSLALTALRDALRLRLSQGADLREAILSGFDRANREVLRHASGSATTLAVVEVDQGRLRSYHVGDSGVLVFGGRGRMRMQTISHSPVGYAVEAGVLDEHEAMEHEDRHLVSNVVGDRGMHVGMSYPLRLKPLDTVLLASDGLFDNVFTDEIVQRLRKGRLHEAAGELVAQCRGRMAQALESLPGKPDDLTLVAYRPGVRR